MNQENSTMVKLDTKNFAIAGFFISFLAILLLGLIMIAMMSMEVLWD